MSIRFIKSIQDIWVNVAHITHLKIHPYYYNSLANKPSKYQIVARICEEDILLNEVKSYSEAQEYMGKLIQSITQNNPEFLSVDVLTGKSRYCTKLDFDRDERPEG